MTRTPATRTAQIAFAVLLAITGGAFFVTQRLKQTPRLVRTLTITRDFSPLIAYRQAAIRFRLEHADDVTVTLIDSGGSQVRRLVKGRHIPADQRVLLRWNGRDDRGRIVPDAEYRVRVSLRKRGRAVILLDTIRVDTRPPRPVVRVDRPEGATGPAIFPGRGKKPVTFSVTGTRQSTERLFVYRTDGPKPQFVARIPARPQGAKGTWDGRAGGRLVAPGTYVIVARDTDSVGNAASSFPFTPARAGDPPGGAGVTVRYVAAQAPSAPVRAGSKLTVFVDARGGRYRWRVRRLGVTRPVADGVSRNVALRLTAPRGVSGVYLVDIIAGPQRATAPVMVQGPGTHPVLVVLPVLSWQGRNRFDDDGDGLPNTLDRGDEVRLQRTLAGGGLPLGFAANEQPLLELLDRPQQRYDISSDLVLNAKGGEDALKAHRGVVLAGLPTWVPTTLAARLRRFIGNGGKVFVPGADVLRRSARLLPNGTVTGGAPTATDIFGTELAPVVRRRVDLLAASDPIGLFDGGDGLFAGFTSFEAVISPAPAAKLVSDAEDPDSGAGGQSTGPVIAAISRDKGLVIRTGLPEWGMRMGHNPNVQALTRRAWSLLSR